MLSENYYHKIMFALLSDFVFLAMHFYGCLLPFVPAPLKIHKIPFQFIAVADVMLGGVIKKSTMGK